MSIQLMITVAQVLLLLMVVAIVFFGKRLFRSFPNITIGKLYIQAESIFIAVLTLLLIFVVIRY